jgi:hypothetical protein
MARREEFRVIRKRLRRLATVLTLAGMCSMLLATGAAQAASTRVVCLGSPAPGGVCSSIDTSTGAIIPGTLTNTPVNPSGRTATTVIVRNDGGQTLNHVKIAGGDAADGKTYNPLFPKPSGDSLPSNLTFEAVIPLSNGVTCDPNTADTFECSIGTLNARKSVSFLVIINAPADLGSTGWWLTTSWNEGWSNTGTNADYTFALGNVVVGEATCANGTANYFLGTENVGLGDGSDTNCHGLNASVGSGRQLGGNGGFASLLIDTDANTPACPSTYTCFGNTVSVNVIGGDPVPGGVQWTITWFGIKSLGGVIHYLDSYGTDGKFVPIALTKKNQCSTSKPNDCWVSVLTSKGNTDPFITVTFITATNGKGGGFF